MLHSRVVGSSTASRRLACPGSIDLELAAPIDRESAAAAEGTACHSAMEHILDHDLQPEDVAGMTFYHHVMTPERVAALAYCHEQMFSVIGTDDEYLTETTYAFPGIPGAFGTGDVTWYSEKRNILGVMDWKFGRGVEVLVEDNAQVKFLLSGARAKGTWPINEETRFHGLIVQPRLDYAGGAFFDAKELDAFETDLAHAVLHRRYEDDNVATGPHCQFCNAVIICPAQRMRFDQFRRLKEIGNDLGAILDAADDLKLLVAAAQKAAHVALEQGAEVPGYKLIEKRGDRVWVDEDKAERWLAKHGVRAEQRRTRPKLLSPAGIENVVPGLKKTMQAVGLWERPERGTAVVKESHKAPAVLKGEALGSALANMLDKKRG